MKLKVIILALMSLFFMSCVNTAYFNTDPGLRYFRTGEDLTMYVIYKNGSEQIDWSGVAEVLKVVEENNKKIIIPED